MDNLKIINDINQSKKYYIKNFNRINKNIGSKIYGNIFNQIESMENYVDENQIEF